MEKTIKSGGRRKLQISAELETAELLPYLLNRARNQMTAVWMTQLRSAGLTHQRWQILSILNFLDGSRIGTIADISGIGQAVVSRVVDQMERDKLVSRRPAPGDNRAVEIWITTTGKRILENLMPAADRFVHDLLKDFSQRDREKLMHLLNRLGDAAEAMKGRSE